MKKKGIRRWITAAVIALGAVTIISCTKMDEDCDYKTNTNTGQKGIIIVNPDKIVK